MFHSQLVCSSLEGVKEEAKPKPVNPMFAELQQVRLELQVQLLARLRKVCVWGVSRLHEVTRISSEVFARMDDWIVGKCLAEHEAVKELTTRLKICIENERPVPHYLELSGNTLARYLGNSAGSQSPDSFGISSGVRRNPLRFGQPRLPNEHPLTGPAPPGLQDRSLAVQEDRWLEEYQAPAFTAAEGARASTGVTRVVAACRSLLLTGFFCLTPYTGNIRTLRHRLRRTVEPGCAVPAGVQERSFFYIRQRS